VIAVLVPAYNEGARLFASLAVVRARAAEIGGVTVFLVDDGSDPPVVTSQLPRPTDVFRIVLARHTVNLGQGAALETARQLALRGGAFDAYVTMDADGQHRMEDAVDLARAIVRGADVVFGNRFRGDSNVPRGRRIVLGAARWFERALTGLRLSDAHNGLRAFSRRALERITIRQNGMAHATEIKICVSREVTSGARGAEALVIEERPVSVRYTEDSVAKGQRSLGAAIIVRDLVAHYLFGERQ
jgi:glycosyltransferase involved in cell wall biosynthesis